MSTPDERTSTPVEQTSTQFERPFDQFQRYRLVADLLRHLRAAGNDTRRLHVLDVGGGTGLLRLFLSDARVTLVDVVPGGAESDLALGDGSRLPFRTDAFDAVCAFDTLEHVPPDRRAEFVAECARVSRRWICLAGPYHTPDVRAAEEELDVFLRDTLALEHRFLREHLELGLPDRDATRAAMERAGARVVSIGHGNLTRWQTLMRLEIAYDEPHLLPLGRRLFELYARLLYPLDRAEPVYRHVVLGILDGSPEPDPAALFDGGVSTEAAAAIDRTFEQALAVLADDTDRKAWLAERAEFERTVALVTKDLVGHREVLADREAQLAEHRRVQGELEQRVRWLFERTPTGFLKKWKRRILGGASSAPAGTQEPRGE